MEDWKDALAALAGTEGITADSTDAATEEATRAGKDKGTSPSRSPRRHREGVVYSTDPSYAYREPAADTAATLPRDKQRLRLAMERAGRAGKTVTLVRGFTGTADDLLALCRELKSKCGVGGAVKDGVIVIQGDHRTRLAAMLHETGYTQTK